MEGFEQLKNLVMQYVRGIWRHRWIAIVISWPLLIAGVMVVDQMKDRYEAKTKVYIDTTSVLKPLLKGLAVETDIQSNVRLMVRTLLSRPNLERVIRLMDMDINVESDEDMEKLLNMVRSRVNISARKRSNIYAITYSDENPQKAKEMVQTFLSIFVEDTLGKSVSESDSAIAFLDKQIEKYEQLLQEAELRLETFKRNNVGVMPNDGANYFSRYQKKIAELERAELELSELVNRRDKLKSQLENITLIDMEDTLIGSYDAKIRQQELRLDDLLLSFTEEHPDVINTRRVLISLLKRKENEREELEQGATVSLDNPVYQQLQILLSESEANISALKARVVTYSRNKQELKKLVDVVPRIEAELKRLNRDYGVHKKNYTTLVGRREQAKISEDVETSSEQVKFRIIEPPHVPTKSNYPNRPLFDLAALALAIGVGYGIGLLISLAQPVIYSISELRALTGLPVLGAVSKFDTGRVLSQRRRNLLLFILSNVLLFVVAAIFIMLHINGFLITSSLKQVLTGI